jgi:hypothetical protein
MERLEKCKILESKGYTYNAETGQIFGSRGFEVGYKTKKGYIALGSNYFNGELLAHHFAWFMTYGNVDFDRLDHKDTNPSNNRIDNLRILTNQQNAFNTNAKGYSWHKDNKRWCSQIVIDGKHIWLGSYKTEQEAREAYLKAKKKYHNI